MKSLMFAIPVAILAFAACGSASADTPSRLLAPITVQPGQRINCTPPSSAAACSALHAQIRQHFSRREIGVLFGARTSYPEALTSYTRMVARYEAFVRDREAAGEASVAVAAR